MPMQLTRLLLLSLLFCLSSSSLSVLFFRHGARTPGDFFSSQIFFEGPKQLTSVGENISKQMGKKFGSFFIKGKVLMISSSVERARRSAKWFLHGAGVREIKEDERDFTDGVGNLKFEEYNINSSFPLFLQTPKSDYLFHGFKKNICPKAARIISSQKNSKILKEKIKSLRNSSLFVELCDGIKNSHLNLVCNPKNLTFSRMKKFYDLIYSVEYHRERGGLKRDIDFGFDKTFLHRLAEAREFYIRNTQLKNKYVVKLVVSSFFKILLDSFKNHSLSQKDNGRDRTNKLLIFSAHDKIMFNILTALLTHKERNKIHETIRPFSSYLQLKVQEVNGDMFIKAYLEGKLLKLRKCSLLNAKRKNGCWMKDFIKIYQKWIQNNLIKKCKEIKLKTTPI